MSQHEIQDPRTQYPTPDIPNQTQPEPGLDSKLKPAADHGVESYVGAGRLAGRKALITGGDSGIGRAVAIAFAREGADVVIGYLPGEQADADETLAQVQKTGQKGIGIQVDLTQEADARNLVQQTVTELGGIDLIVNNAGKQVYQESLADITTRQLSDTFTVNIFAMFWICQEALEHLPAGASIINTTSIQATQPSPGLLDYASTKGAITTFTRGLSQQLTPSGIRVNGVAPGPVWTPLQPSYGQPQKKLTKFGQQTPLGRAGQPAELAPLYVFLASQESSFVSGEIYGATGGELR